MFVVRSRTTKMLRKQTLRAFFAKQTLRAFSTKKKPWEEPISESKFSEMRDILSANSPIGLEAAMS